jgi:cysteine-rich repeat protein
VSPREVDCGGGVVCPAGKLCASVEAFTFCVTPDQAELCKDIADGAACGTDGTCHGGACLDNECGNALLDVGEICDVAALAEGERCSRTCDSNETCGNGVTDLDTGEQCDDGNRRDHDGCSSACANETLAWSRTSAPAATASAKAAYDPVRGTAVVFDSSAGEVMECDGSNWRRFSTSNPAPRGDRFAMAFDPGQGGVVLFGGTIDGSVRGDTYLWDGLQWSLLPTGPRLQNPALAYDVGTAQLVAFGSNSSTGAPETWTLGATAQWTFLSPASQPPAPVGIARSAMATDARRGNIVYYDGATKQTWTYAAGTWTMRSPSVTPQVTRTALAYVPELEKVVMFGGVDTGTVSARTYQWDGTTWSSLTPSNSGLARAEHALAADGRGHVLAFGGTSNASSPAPRADTWLFDGSAWSEAVRPPARSGMAAAVDSRRNVIVRFSGSDDLVAPADADTWEGGRDGWTKFADGPGADDSPPPLIYAKMVYDSAHDELVLFGGAQDGPIYDDRTWIRHGTMWTVKHPTPSPPPRIWHAMAFDAARGVTVLTGGRDESGNTIDDTWTWDGATWTQVTTPGPTPRQAAAMAYDPVAQHVVLYGGYQTNPPASLEDVWLWDGAWHAVSGATGVQPGAAALASLTWDPAHTCLVLSGGQSRPFDAWLWRGSMQTREWEPLGVFATPPAREGEAVVPSLDGSGITMFGGNAPPLDDWWELRSQGPRTSDVCAIAIDGDGDGQTGCDDPDCWPICTPLCPPATSCPPGAPSCGDGTCSALESCATCPADCTTSCAPVCGDSVCVMGEACPGDCP